MEHAPEMSAATVLIVLMTDFVESTNLDADVNYVEPLDADGKDVESHGHPVFIETVDSKRNVHSPSSDLGLVD